MKHEILKTWESFYFDRNCNAVIFVTPSYITTLSSPNVFVGEDTRIETITKFFRALGVDLLFTESKNLIWDKIQFFHQPLALAVTRFDRDQVELARRKKQMVEGRWTLMMLEERSDLHTASSLQERVNAIKGYWMPYTINPAWLKWNERIDVKPLRFIFGDRTPPITEGEKSGRMSDMIRYFALHIPDNSAQALNEINKWRQL